MTAVGNAFMKLLTGAQEANHSLLCVGLDPDIARFPKSFQNITGGNRLVRFNRAIIEATSDLACCYKPNLGFYLHFGMEGLQALTDLREAIPSHIPVLLDAKVGDIDTTTAAYARAYFDEWSFDAVTANPFMGKDSLDPLLAYQDKCIFLLAKTSNPGSGYLQDRVISGPDTPVSHLVASSAVQWNTAGNVGLVVGATYPAQLADIRTLAPDIPILVPGVGAQQGELEASVKAGVGNGSAPLLVNASRAISYASSGSDFQEAARAAAADLRDRLNAARSN